MELTNATKGATKEMIIAPIAAVIIVTTEAFFVIMKNYESTYLRLKKWLNKSMACWYSILFWNFSTDKYDYVEIKK